MNKTAFNIIKTVIALILTVLCLSSCEGHICSENYIKEEVKASWYEQGGYKYTCSICGDTYFEYKTKSYVEECKTGAKYMYDTIKSKLKDPESAQFSGSLYAFKLPEDDCYKLYFVINFNAKNGFGGYVGYQTVVFNGRIDNGVVSYNSFQYVSDTSAIKNSTYICGL